MDTPRIPGGTPFRTARVMALMAGEIPAGSQVRTVSVPDSLHHVVRAYGFAQGTGYAFAVFNDTLSVLDTDARVRSSRRNSFTAVYGAAQYDKSNQWVGPVSRRLDKVGASKPLSLPPYSVSVLALK